MPNNRTTLLTIILAGLTGRNVLELVSMTIDRTTIGNDNSMQMPDTHHELLSDDSNVLRDAKVASASNGAIAAHSDSESESSSAVEYAVSTGAQPQQQFPFDTDGTFAGCLLWKDDNHHLIEWLAYSYQRLPLRRLIIAVDAASRTSPSPILQRYTSRGLMKIDLWNDTDVFPEDVLQRRKPIDQMTANEQINLHRYRQKSMLRKCMHTLHSEGRWKWVSLVDIDEFLLPNRFADRRLQFPTEMTPSNTTMFDYLETAKTKFANDEKMTGPCIPIKRLRFGARKSAPYKVQAGVPAGFSGYDLTTYRYRWHLDIQHKQNRVGKMFIDLSRVNITDLRTHQDTNPHRPIKSVCPARYMFALGTETAFLAHHYTGTEEHWNFREDARRDSAGDEISTSFSVLEKASSIQDDSIRGWLQEFVDKVGVETAKELLKGSGRVLHPSHFSLT